MVLPAERRRNPPSVTRHPPQAADNAPRPPDGLWAGKGSRRLSVTPKSQWLRQFVGLLLLALKGS